MPEKGKEDILQFKAHHRQMRVPYIIYADSECLNIPVEGCANDPTKSSTRQIAMQPPCSYYYTVVRCDGQVKQGKLYRGENAMAHLLTSLNTELEAINDVFQNPAKMLMTDADMRAFDIAEVCHICGDKFNPNKVKSHWPDTGLYRGAAHRHCNLKESYPANMDKSDRTAFDAATSCELCGKPFGGNNTKAKLFDNDGVYRGAYHKACKPKRIPQRRVELYEFEKQEYMAATAIDCCCICGEQFGLDKVRDHCHITGRYRGAAHNSCNLNLRITPYKTKVPVVFHNLRGYDGHLIMQALGGVEPELRRVRTMNKNGVLGDYWVPNNQISCIPNNMEKYLTFSIGQLKFIDSLQFLNSSLDSLSGNLHELAPVCCGKPTVLGRLKRSMAGSVISSTGRCKYCGAVKRKHTAWESLKTKFRVTTASLETEAHSKVPHLLLRKGVYPYEYVESFEKFNDPKLPPKEAFYSRLTREQISDEDYEHAQIVWKKFDCKTLGDYHDLYLRTDVHLLADVFEAFRDISMQHYDLDPAHYFSSPGLAWDALLKKTKVKLELLTDIDMHLFMEKGLRGGIVQVSKRFAKANNPRCPDYNARKATSWLLYQDANNLYGWAMMQLLPVGAFQWVEDLTLKDVLDTADNASEGYIIEADIEYPDALHDLHNDYPLAPESMSIPEAWLSDYQRTLVNELGGKYTGCNKLVPNLRRKEKYVIHYRNLKLYCSLGMQVTKIHRACKFRQEAWMVPYIQLNTNLRSKAKSAFEKDFYKLMNNAVFGKTMENLRKRIRVDLVRIPTDADERCDRLRRLIADPAFKSFKIFDGNLAAVHSIKSKLKLNRPVYIGQAVLDLSKHLMYDFWYNKIKLRYGEKAQLCYTDTDSLLFEVETPDAYADMKEDSDLYDFSDYPKEHTCYSDTNKKVPGLFKDECNGRPMAEFVGLRPKMYSILLADGDNIKKAKGVQRVVVKKDLRHESYKTCLDEHKEMRHTQVVIRSKKHQIGVYEQVKTSLSPLDTKKWIAPDGVTTRAYGHYRIEREVNEAMEAHLAELLLNV
jgi:hypothetical protein